MEQGEDGRLRSLGIAALAAMWAVALYGVLVLPATLPQRWSLDGQIQAYGSKWALLMLPISATVATAVLRALRNVPRLPLNLPFDVPEDRQDAVEAIARRYLDVTATAMALGFALLEAAIVRASATGELDWTLGASIGAFVVLILGTVTAMLAQIYRASRA